MLSVLDAVVAAGVVWGASVGSSVWLCMVSRWKSWWILGCDYM